MSELIEVKVSELVGLALDYAAGLADGREMELPSAVRGRKHVVWCDPFDIRLDGKVIGRDKTRRNWLPSTDWAHGGPLIEKYGVSLDVRPLSGRCDAYCKGWMNDCDTHLIAACRAIVASVCGPVVSVPRELLEQQ